MSETHEEWRVTGDPGEAYPPYEFTWSALRNSVHYGDPEAEARSFLALLDSVNDKWRDGPHLHKRTVTVTPWEAMEA